jgi:hypothetical protein
LIRRAKERFIVHELTPSPLERNLVRLNKVTNLFGFQSTLLLTNPRLPGRTRPLFNAENYDYIIPINEHSLYWLHLTSPTALSRCLYYSLEVNKLSDPFNEPRGNAFIKQETALLKEIKALIIQDKLRAAALLEAAGIDVPCIYFPVSVPGNEVRERSKYLYEKLKIPISKNIVLYFGAVYKERLLPEIVRGFEHKANSVLVLHGPDDFSSFATESEHICFSHELVEYDELSSLISSATIGLAIYDNSWPNTRLTAFSSEKVARYLQCGVPFIALDNESYRALHEEFCCCELIANADDLFLAVDRILASYSDYSSESYKAFNKYYRIESTIMPLVQYIQGGK